MGDFNHVFSKFNAFINHDIGIDLGTKNTVVYVQNQGIVLSEDSMVAVDQSTQSVIAIGNDAYKMIGRTPGNITALRPMKDGVIADFDMAKKMIETFIQKTKKRGALTKPRILIGIPWGITAVEKRAVTEAAYSAGAKEAYLIDEPMAAALGSNLPVSSPKGHLLIDIGGGTTEVAVISLSGIVVCKSIRVAGDEFDDAIMSHCKKNYNLLIGGAMAERIKIEIGSAMPLETEKEISVKGRNLLSGLPQSYTLSSYEIRDALSDAVQCIANIVKSTLELTPPELSGDIIEYGITMTGGGSLLNGLADYIAQETNLKVHVITNPLPCVALGTGMILEDKALFEKMSASISK